jgi:hypothetical protein
MDETYFDPKTHTLCFTAFEKKLQIQTRKISDLESDAASNKSLADVFASMTMPQGGTAGNLPRERERERE